MNPDSLTIPVDKIPSSTAADPTKPHRILLLNGDGGDGGIQNYFLGLVPRLQSLDREIVVGAPQDGGFLTRCREFGAETWTVGMRNKFDIRAATHLARLLRERPVEVINAQQERTLLLAWLACLLLPQDLRPILIQTEHNRTVDRLRSSKRVREMRASTLLLHRLIARYAHGFIAVSAAVKEFLANVEAISPERVVVVPVGVTPSALASGKPPNETRDALCIPSSAPVVLTLAKLKPQKDIETFLKTARIVLNKFGGAIFVIAGSGPEKGALKRLAVDLGIDRSVLFLGFQRDIASLLSAADVFLLTSQWEGLPRVVLEAMAAGKPVVATAVSGVPEVVANGVTGYLVPRQDPLKIAEAVLLLLGDSQRRQQLGEAGRRRVRAEFSEDSIAKQLLSAYQYFYAVGTSN